jgi:hypothetical protein
VYNRYVGNTGTYHRVEEPPNVRVLRERNIQQARQQEAARQAAAERQAFEASQQQAREHAAAASRGGPVPRGAAPFSGGQQYGDRHSEQRSHPASNGGGLSSLLSMFGFKNKPSLSRGGGLNGFLDHLLPAGFDVGDILLLLFLLYFFIESGDEEFLIILGVIAFSIFKDR